MAAAPDSSAVYVANIRFGTNLVWRVGTNDGSQTDLWKSGDAYTNAVLSGDGSRFFTTFKSSKGTPISMSMTQPTVQYRKSTTHTSTLMAMHKFRIATLMATTNHHSSCPMTAPMVPSQRQTTKLSFSTGLILMARSWSIGFRLITQSVQSSLLKLIQALLSTLAAATKSPKYLLLVTP